MSARFAILCPGQGGQHDAMFELARIDARAGALLDTWLADIGVRDMVDAVPACGGDSSGGGDDKHAGMFANRFAQPLIVAATLATYEALRDSLPAAALVAGYSVGELSAYAVAGAISAAEAVRLAARRAHAMDACVAPEQPHAMLAVSGIGTSALAPPLAAHGYQLAIVNGADSAIVGGLASRAAALEQVLTSAGGRVQRLSVRVASHTPYMKDAVVPFRQALDGAAWSPPTVAVIAGTTAQPVRRVDAAIACLAAQLTDTVRWADCMDALAESGVDMALELGPGKALAAMLHARHPHIAVRSVAEFRSLAGVRTWLQRRIQST